MRNKSVSGSITLKGDDSPTPGAFEAVFSTFGIVDADGEVVVREALEPHDGKEVPVVWGHDWFGPPVGKGKIAVDQDRARIVGEFNLASSQGRDAYETVKFMGGLQEYSWGFGVTEIDSVEIDGQSFPAITGVDPVEVSPVLVGSNPETGTLDIKGAKCPTCGHVKSDADDETNDDDSAALAAELVELELAEVDLASIGLS